MKVRGYVRLWHLRGGVIVHTCEGPNIVTDGGKNLIANLVRADDPTGHPSHIALGSNSTAVAETQTILVTEIANTRTATGLGTVSANELKYPATLTNSSGGNWNVKEAGLFNDVVSGTMIARWLSGDLTVGDTESLTIDWTLTFG